MTIRRAYLDELEQLRVQVEVMGLRVGANLDRARAALQSGDLAAAEAAVASDDEIDEMELSLGHRCTQVLAQQAPVAADLRLILSVSRVAGELERVGDLALRVALTGSDQPLISAVPSTFALLHDMADVAVEVFGRAMSAWSTRSVPGAEVAAGSRPEMAERMHQLKGELEGGGAAALTPAVVLRSYIAGQALDRIAVHAAIIGARTAYVLTGDAGHLVREVR